MISQPLAAKPHSRTRLIVQVAVSLLVVAIFCYLLKGIDRAMTWLEDATLLATAACTLPPTRWCG